MSALLGGAAPSAGTKAARVAAIKAVITGATYLKTADAGDKFVDGTALLTWLRTELGKIASEDAVPAERQDYVRSVAATVETQSLVAPFVRVVGRANWQGNPYWPTSEGMTAAEKTAALVKARDGLRASSTRLSAHYEAQRQALVDRLPSDYDLKIAPGLPAITIRNIESRAYVYTYVTDWGWESAPSPVSDIVDCDENDTVTLVAAVPPGGLNIVRMRLYRSNTGNAGAAFQFVVESSADVSDWSPAPSRTYTDERKRADLGEVCPSMAWDAPPDDMQGLRVMPNGTLIGFRANQLIPSESFIPYAYPLQYRQTTDVAIVGLGVVGNSAVALTKGHPYLVSGADGATLSAQRLEHSQACVSKRSIAEGEGGVLYASPDGVCMAGPSGVQVLTEGAFTRAQWQAFLGPQAQWPNAFAAYHEGVYLILNYQGAGYALDTRSRKISALTQAGSGLYSDSATDTLYVVSGTSLLNLFAGPTYNAATWRSKIIVMGTLPSFGAIRVESNFEAAVTVKVYAEGVLRHTAVFSGASAREPQRLPAGLYRDIEVQVEAACPVTRVTLATTMSELQA